MDGASSRPPAVLATVWMLLLLATSARCGERPCRATPRPHGTARRGGQVQLRAPKLQGWSGLEVRAAVGASRRRPRGYRYWAVARKAELLLYGSYGEGAWLWGKIRQGQRVPVRLKARGQGCSRGSWYETPSRAYICNTHGYTITTNARLQVEALRPPVLKRPLPYRYFKATKKPALRFERLPREKELTAARAVLAEGSTLPEVVESAVEGAYFFAVDRTKETEAGTFYRTTLGNYVHEEGLQPVSVPPMHGELLRGRNKLPVGFVYRDRVRLHCIEKRGAQPALEPCGEATKHARFHIKRAITVNGERYAVLPRSRAVRLEALRVARKIERPGSIGNDARWIHFDLSEQTAVAYRGSRPVFATLISSGKEGHETPTGTYEIYLKYISDRMSGDDPKDGPYDIGEVPWVMYYKSSYAVHGAYWHNVFGQTRSHGCTNLAPADARWLYYWTLPKVPRGWHGQYTSEGTHLHFTS